MNLVVRGIPTPQATHIWNGGADAHGQAPVRIPARGGANPCRHCLQLIPDGQDKLVLAHRPFAQAQPYAETGPVFLHAQPCEPYMSDRLPGWFSDLSPALVRGYDERDWIVYESAEVVDGRAILEACQRILGDPRTAYVHVRSKFNCYQCRVERAEASG